MILSFRFILVLLMLAVWPLKASMVDIWQFASNENRTRAIELAKQIRCPQCQNQNLIESNSPIAEDLRLEVYQLVDDGKTDEEIVQSLVERYGEFISYNPKLSYQTLLLWGAPFILLLFGLMYCWRYIKNRHYDSALSDQQQHRLNRLLQQNSWNEE